MTGPAGPFTPWLEHELFEGQCTRCGLIPPPGACCQVNPNLAYTHAGAYLTVKPTGAIVPCRMPFTQQHHV